MSGTLVLRLRLARTPRGITAKIPQPEESAQRRTIFTAGPQKISHGFKILRHIGDGKGEVEKLRPSPNEVMQLRLLNITAR